MSLGALGLTALQFSKVKFEIFSHATSFGYKAYHQLMKNVSVIEFQSRLRYQPCKAKRHHRASVSLHLKLFCSLNSLLILLVHGHYQSVIKLCLNDPKVHKNKIPTC